MKKRYALLFALLGTGALTAISVAISFRSSEAIIISIVGFLLVMAVGFWLKRRTKQQQN